MTDALRVGLFVTCLVDMFRPTIGFASIKLLEDAGCRVHVPVAQTCCGQPAWNARDKADAREIAEAVIQNFEDFDYIVTPSKPCANMLKENYHELFQDDETWNSRVNHFSKKVFEIYTFLEEVVEIKNLNERLVKRADILTGDDLGALMETANTLKRQGITKEIRHVTEVLAGMTDSPPIGGR